jgi:membrane protease subunit (stomatin/prohibitin family)
MSSQPARPAADAQTSAPQQTDRQYRSEQRESEAREMPCPVCGEPMPDLKGGKATICPNCGFKDSCCY